MTVEERAKRTVDELFWGIGVNPTKKDVARYMAQALRDQIEDCVAIVAGEASLCSKGDKSGNIKGGYIGLHDAWLRIRALANQTDQTEGKGVER